MSNITNTAPTKKVIKNYDETLPMLRVYFPQWIQPHTTPEEQSTSGIENREQLRIVSNKRGFGGSVAEI